jgi:hypothetical protein
VLAAWSAVGRSLTKLRVQVTDVMRMINAIVAHRAR